MDWTTPLRSQQMDFIERLKSGHLLHCDLNGRYSELRTISGSQLRQLLDRNSALLGISQNGSSEHFERQLGRECLKASLDDFIVELDQEFPTDFALTSNPGVRIRILTCLETQKAVEWSVKTEEIQKNAVLVFTLLQPSPPHSPSEDRVILAGFLPTMMIKLQLDNAIFTLDNLLYCGGLHSYLESLNYNKKEKIEIKDTSSLLNWTPDLDAEDLVQGNREDWKQKFIQWLQAVVVQSDKEGLRLHLYDLLNTHYHREALWKLYVKRERQIYDVVQPEEIDIVVKASNRQAESLMLELAGLSKMN